MYNEVIIEHSRNTNNKRLLEHADIEERGHNPSCGDEIILRIKLDDKGTVVEELAFTGDGCAISQASASILCDVIRGRNISDVKRILEIFIKMVKGELKIDADLDELDDAVVFENIKNLPCRIKCALLAWHTLKLIISK